MKNELFPFQKRALKDVQGKVALAMWSYYKTHAPQVVSFTAPTGAGKTIVMASLIENIFCGDDEYEEQPNAIVLWLSDSPQLNEQSKLKIDTKADKIRLGQCITVNDDSFDRETFEDGHIYFLNTQKLSKTSNLTKHSDGRMYTIWETIANTVREKSDRLYFLIDEAHRGMQGKDAARATTIMQKFIKGSPEDGITPMPVVIGMSATTARFNRLVEGTTSTIHKSVVTADEVRSSGLLKDRIVITYPEETTVNTDMAVLQAAADDWKEKWDHWYQYCYEQHYAYVNPVFVIQVLNSTSSKISDTNLDDCLQKIEERTGFKFETGQVVHTFGQTQANISVNGIDVRYEEPSRIADDKNIRIVFFKENLSTGWDCPRAETMMSFRRATDATYIAQLLGRMIRTPMQMHIQVDDVLNDVHLYLPHFDANTVNDVVKELQNAEGGDIPTDIYGESLGEKTFETLTVKPHKNEKKDNPNQISLFETDGKDTTVPAPDVTVSSNEVTSDDNSNNKADVVDKTNLEQHETVQDQPPVIDNVPNQSGDNDTPADTSPVVESKEDEETEVEEDLFDREEIMKFINDSGLLSYDIRTVKINNYVSSMYKMAHLLTQYALDMDAVRNINAEVIKMIRDYIDALKGEGKYDDYSEQVKQFKLSTQIFDAFGESVDNHSVHSLYTTSDSDVERQFRAAESNLSNEGIGKAYCNKYIDWDDPNTCMIDVILFTADKENLKTLAEYAEKKFHEMNDTWRHRIATINVDKLRRQYDSIVSDGDVISKHNFRLPETIQIQQEKGGTAYRTHLFVSYLTGFAQFKLNTWEAGVIAEEEKRDDFVCWIRNPSRSWGLCIPYKMNEEAKSAYPDFLIVRKDPYSKYVIDILEPHNPEFKDNLGKAKGFAEYANQNPGLGRIQLIRMTKDAAGNNKFKRLDMAKGAIRQKVSHALSNDELDHIFDMDGIFE